MYAKMVKIALLMLVSFSFFLFPEVTLTWETDWQTGLKQAAADKRPVMIDFFTDWCPHCKRLDKTTFKTDAVGDYFKKENYMLIKINPEKDRAAEAKFKVYSYPTLVIFNTKGKEIDRILGYRSAEDLVKALEDLKKGIGTLQDLKRRYKSTKGQATETNFDLIFKIMNKYIARADYPQALELVDEVVKLDYDNKHKKAAAAMFQRGYIYYKWKKYRKAADALIKIHKAYPKSGEAVDGFRAAAYYIGKLNEPKLVLDVLKQFIEVYPQGEHAEKTRKRIKKLEEQLKIGKKGNK
jgi:thioredoxin-related protein